MKPSSDKGKKMNKKSHRRPKATIPNNVTNSTDSARLRDAMELVKDIARLPLQNCPERRKRVREAFSGRWLGW